jgi:small subunit ribosomal protein S6
MAERILGSARDIAGRKREYETIYILRPDTANEGIAAVNGRVRGVIEERGGKLLKVVNWGRRRLAYPVQKQTRGIYLFFDYLGDPGLVEELERHLRNADAVIRYYSVKVAENVEVDARASEVTDESFASAAVPGPDEEATTIGQGGVRSLGEEEFEGGFDFEEAVFGSTGSSGARKE